jgi:hypothetical protein
VVLTTTIVIHAISPSDALNHLLNELTPLDIVADSGAEVQVTRIHQASPPCREE